jgi:hypothetical protein
MRKMGMKEVAVQKWGPERTDKFIYRYEFI